MQNQNILTERQREIYNAVEQYKKDNPDSSNMAALKATKMNPSTYAAARKRLLTGKGYETKLKAYKKGVEINGKRKYTRRPKMITLPVEETPVTTSVVAFVGNPTDVVKATREFLKGH